MTAMDAFGLTIMAVIVVGVPTTIYFVNEFNKYRDEALKIKKQAVDMNLAEYITDSKGNPVWQWKMQTLETDYTTDVIPDVSRKNTVKRSQSE